MAAQELSSALWRERELLELLLFKLEVEQLLLTAGKSRWIQQATREVEVVMERLRSAGLERTVEVASLAQEWGTSEDATLRELTTATAAGPWREVFQSHLDAMTELTERIAEVRDSNAQFLRAAVRSTQETLTNTDAAAASGYDDRGSSAPDSSSDALFVDRNL